MVLLTFVLAYHRSGNPLLVAQKTARVPDCLGSDGESEALQVANVRPDDLILSGQPLVLPGSPNLANFSTTQEGLRLYPSTKRIYRAANLDGPATAGRVSAYVEKCHRHPGIWGADALEFRPERFENLTALQTETYFPFGLRPHVCPARSGFGERLVTLLVVPLVRTFDPAMVSVRFDDKVLDGDAGAPLPTERADMEGWLLVPRKWK